MDKNVIGGICARSQSLHFNLHLYLDPQSLLGPHNLSNGSVSMVPMHGSVVSLRDSELGKSHFLTMTS